MDRRQGSWYRRSVVLAAAGGAVARRGSAAAADAHRIILTVDGQTATATLLDNPAAREFLALLPVTVAMDDLFGREKHGPLPRRLSEGPRTTTYVVGDIAYWSPNHDVAIFYRIGGDAIPSPGLIALGRLDGGAALFNRRGSLTVKIARAAP